MVFWFMHEMLFLCVEVAALQGRLSKVDDHTLNKKKIKFCLFIDFY